ncbi:MAG: sigma-54 dependent transcriptional regulator [Verrucomicrobiota bacterium]
MNAIPLILRGQELPPVLSRLLPKDRALDFHPENVRDLDTATAGRVYVLPSEIFKEDFWPRLRTLLTAARRLYVIYGSGKFSAEPVQAMRDGAFDFVYTSEKAERWVDALDRAAESQALWLKLFDVPKSSRIPLLVGRSAEMESVRKAISRAGPVGASVLVNGESGTGKELAAQSIHNVSGRRGPFVAVNCAAIPGELMEAELFGAEKGAYTGSVSAREGLVEQAAGGTLFLDEIGEMDINLQPKLLRFLETRRARRVGGRGEYAADVRIVSATNRNLEERIDQQDFRADLFYRLAEVTLQLPPLRHHPEDIPLLAAHFLTEANDRFAKQFLSLEPMLASDMMEYSWPGNVRELRAAIHRLVIFHDGAVMRREWWKAPAARPDAPPADMTPGEGGHRTAAPAATGPPMGATGMRLSRQQQWDLARKLLAQSGNDRTWTAAQLGIHPATLFRWTKSGKV